MTPAVPRTFKVNGSKVKVTRDITDELSKVKLGEIILEPSATRSTMCKVIKSNTEIAITPLDCVRI